jgi:hypothetical protein
MSMFRRHITLVRRSAARGEVSELEIVLTERTCGEDADPAGRAAPAVPAVPAR